MIRQAAGSGIELGSDRGSESIASSAFSNAGAGNNNDDDDDPSSEEEEEEEEEEEDEASEESSSDSDDSIAKVRTFLSLGQPISLH